LLLSFIFQGCNVQNEVKSPGDLLLEKLEDRFESRDYKVTGTVDNPFEKLGKQVAAFKDDIRKDKGFLQQLGREKREKVSEASFFKFVSGDAGKLGIEDPEVLEIVKEKVETFTESTGNEFNEETFYKLNNEFLSYPANRSGPNEMLEKTLNNDKFSETQRNVGKSIVRQVNAAAGLVEQLAAVQAIEKDIYESKIEKTDKDFLLFICALLEEDFKLQLGQGYVKKVAVETIVTIVIVVVGALTGAALICTQCGNGPVKTLSDCPTSCWLTGAVVGGLFGYIFTPLGPLAIE
jgi:hypothetical protein